LLTVFSKRYDQTPYCDGIHVNRILFDAHATGLDLSFISGQLEVSDDGNIILNAGDAQGIWKGAEVEIYDSNIVSTKTHASLGIMMAVSVITPSKSILEKKTIFKAPGNFYAKPTQRHPDEKITIY
jgi:hypothetical protein